MFYDFIQQRLASLIVPIAGSKKQDFEKVSAIVDEAVAWCNEHVVGDVGNISSKNSKVKYRGNAELDTQELFSKHQTKLPINDQTFVIKINPNAANYESFIPSYAQEMIHGHYNIVCFNYPGAGRSTGKAVCTDDWVDSVIAQARVKIAAGADPEKIYLDGRSIGGAFAVLAAKRLHEEGIKVNVYNRFSFSKLSNVIGGWVSQPFQKIGLPKFADVIFRKVSGAARKVLQHYQLEMDVDDAYNAIPNDYKDYSVIKTSKKIKQYEKVADDKIIMPSASLHASQKTNNKDEKSYLKTMEVLCGNKKPTETEESILDKIVGIENVASEVADAVLDKRNGDANYLIKKQREFMNDRKVTLRTGGDDSWSHKNRKHNAHNVSTLSLETRSGKYANTQFCDFIFGSRKSHDEKQQAVPLKTSTNKL